MLSLSVLGQEAPKEHFLYGNYTAECMMFFEQGDIFFCPICPNEMVDSTLNILSTFDMSITDTVLIITFNDEPVSVNYNYDATKSVLTFVYNEARYSYKVFRPAELDKGILVLKTVIEEEHIKVHGDRVESMAMLFLTKK